MLNPKNNGFFLVNRLLELIMHDQGPSLLYKLTGGSGDVEDIDLNAEYEDLD